VCMCVCVCVYVCVCKCRHTYNPRTPHTHLALHADDISLLTQAWRRHTLFRRLSHSITNLRKYFTNLKTLIKFPQNYNNFIFQAPPPPPRGSLPGLGHLCVQGLGRPLCKFCSKFKTPLHPALEHRRK